MAKAQGKDSMKAFSKLVQVVDGQPRLRSDPPLIVPLEALLPDLAYHHVEDALRDLLRSYRRSGWTLARAHALSGDAMTIASHLGGGDRLAGVFGCGMAFDQDLAAFAESYADQNERDYAALRQAVDNGTVTSEAG